MNYYLAYRPNPALSKSGRARERARAAEPRMIRQGVYWRFLVLGPFGFFLSRSWIAAVLSLCLNALLFRFGGQYAGAFAWGLHILLAVFAAEIMGWDARIRGQSLDGVWMGRSAGDARLRMMDRERNRPSHDAMPDLNEEHAIS